MVLIKSFVFLDYYANPLSNQYRMMNQINLIFFLDRSTDLSGTKGE